jgi:hypothetical protein
MLDGKLYTVHMHDIAGPDEKTSLEEKTGLDETTGLNAETDGLIRDADGIVYFYSVTSKLNSRQNQKNQICFDILRFRHCDNASILPSAY